MDRGTERILIVVGGITCIILGYILFARDKGTHEGRLNFKSKAFSLILTGTGAGLFFMALGAIILIFMALSRVSESETIKTKELLPDSDRRIIEKEIIHKKESKKPGKE